MKTTLLTSLLTLLIVCSFSINSAQAQGEKWENETLMIEMRVAANRLVASFSATVSKENIKSIVVISASGVKELETKSYDIPQLLKRYQDEGWEPYSEQMFAIEATPRVLLKYSFKRRMK